MSQETITRFYDAFQQHDAETMGALYHPEATFSDPVFQRLNQQEVQAMWAMLMERSGGDLTVEFHSVEGDDVQASCTWEAHYHFSASGRKVHNIIRATMKFKDGLIVEHTDDFNFWRWSRMALGTTGILLGWSPIVKNKVRNTARKSLEKYMLSR